MPMPLALLRGYPLFCAVALMGAFGCNMSGFNMFRQTIPPPATGSSVPGGEAPSILGGGSWGESAPGTIAPSYSMPEAPPASGSSFSGLGDGTGGGGVSSGSGMGFSNPQAAPYQPPGGYGYSPPQNQTFWQKMFARPATTGTVARAPMTPLITRGVGSSDDIFPTPARSGPTLAMNGWNGGQYSANIPNYAGSDAVTSEIANHVNEAVRSGRIRPDQAAEVARRAATKFDGRQPSSGSNKSAPLRQGNTLRKPLKELGTLPPANPGQARNDGRLRPAAWDQPEKAGQWVRPANGPM